MQKSLNVSWKCMCIVFLLHNAIYNDSNYWISVKSACTLSFYCLKLFIIIEIIAVKSACTFVSLLSNIIYNDRNHWISIESACTVSLYCLILSKIIEMGLVRNIGGCEAMRI